jgi:putative transposase
MPNYRRSFVPGGTYFFTVALADRRSDLLTQEIASIRAAIARTKHLHPFRIHAWVILPDHMHAVWTLPEGDSNFPLRWTLIKRGFSSALPPTEPRSPSRASKAERGIWQRRFWEHTIRGEADFARHVDYVHFNPVKHGLASSPADWPHSTFHQAISHGAYPTSWAQQERRYDANKEQAATNYK